MHASLKTMTKISVITKYPTWKSIAVQLAEVKGHPEVESLRRAHLQWLLETHQEEKAGQMKEAEGDYMAAINMYLKAGMPAKASR